jgi:hippurate hydrolase
MTSSHPLPAKCQSFTRLAGALAHQAQTAFSTPKGLRLGQQYEESTMPTISTPSLVERIVPAFVEALGSAQVKKATPVMGAEDFAYYSEGNVPICMFWLGTISPERIEAARSKGETLPALHSSKYHPTSGPSIATGVRAMTAAVVKLLPPRP